MDKYPSILFQLIKSNEKIKQDQGVWVYIERQKRRERERTRKRREEKKKSINKDNILIMACALYPLKVYITLKDLFVKIFRRKSNIKCLFDFVQMPCYWTVLLVQFETFVEVSVEKEFHQWKDKRRMRVNRPML